MARSFWAIELHPNKEYATTPDFDLHLTQAVLTGASKDKSERSVVSVKIADEEGGEAKTFSIASLKLDHAESQGLDLVFDSEEELVFTVSGKNVVHLSGYLIPPTEDEFGDEFGSDDEDIPSGEEDMLSEEEDDEEIDEEELKAQLAKRKAPQAQNGAPAAKKAKQEAPQAQKPKQPQQTPNKPAEQKKPQQQQQKSPAQQQKVTTRKLQGGIEATILQEGTGKVATRGNRVLVKYIGKLTKNNKVFDKSLDRPFPFNLGKREVITGWEIGVDGMKEGEKRRLVIPPNLAYGSSGAPPDIPPNSSLTFDVELVKIAGRN